MVRIVLRGSDLVRDLERVDRIGVNKASVIAIVSTRAAVSFEVRRELDGVLVTLAVN